MPDYGREIYDQTGAAALMLLLKGQPMQQKRTLLLSYLQLGIDLYGIACAIRDSAKKKGFEGLQARRQHKLSCWPGGAGHHNGRKWPVLFAGMMLGNQDMIDITKDDSPVAWSEDDQTFIIDSVRTKLGYPVATGEGEWGVNHFLDGDDDDGRWEASAVNEEAKGLPGQTEHKRTNQGLKYRRCCTTNAGWGTVLAAAAFPGAREAWGHEPYFLYQRRYRKVEGAKGAGDFLAWRRYVGDWQLKMFDRHSEAHNV